MEIEDTILLIVLTCHGQTDRRNWSGKRRHYAQSAPAVKNK